MASEMRAVMRKSCAEEMALRPSRKPRILSATESAAGGGERADHGVSGRGDGSAGDADGDGEERDEGGAGEREQAGADEEFTVGEIGGGEEQGGGEDDGGGAEVEHALDGVDGDLRADGELDALGDESGTDDVGEAAEEGDGGEADELRGDEDEGRDAFGGGEEDRPARGAQPVGGVDEGDADGDVGPGDEVELLKKMAQSKWMRPRLV